MRLASAASAALFLLLTPVAAAPAGAQIIAGRVVTDAPRQPARGVRVRVLRAGGDAAAGRAAADTAPVSEAVTAADGVFSVLLPGPGTYRVRVADHAPGPPLTLPTADSTDSREYVLPAAPAVAATDSAPSPSAGPPDAELNVLLRGGIPLQPSQVDRVACVLPSNDRPPYPSSRLRLGATVSFGVLFVVDSAGRPDAGTLRVRDAPDPAFVDAVRGWIPHLRARAAEVRGRRVPQVVWLPLTFFLQGQQAPPRVEPPRGFEVYRYPGPC